MERSLLDTDIFSEILRRRDRSVVRRASTYLAEFGVFTLSAISIVELVDGFHRRQLDGHITKLLSQLDSEQHVILPLDQGCAEIAGRIFGDLHRTGQPIGRADPLIAATAIAHSLVLVTGNTQHFERIQALGYPLRLSNWRES